MSECGCVYCIWHRALAKALAESMDAEMMSTEPITFTMDSSDSVV